MPRRARLELPGVPLHVTHRGVNRCAIFMDQILVSFPAKAGIHFSCYNVLRYMTLSVIVSS
jgi:hypothetical protein